MKSSKEFPFHRARRITKDEVAVFRQGIEDLHGRKRPKRKGRPPKGSSTGVKQLAAAIDSEVLAPLRKQARKQGIDYQVLVNRLLLHEFS